MESTDFLQPRLKSGLVIPAHPLALTSDRKLDEMRQQGLTQYYLESGAGGLAVGVHTTQFQIRDPKHGLLKPVLELAAETVRTYSGAQGETASTVLIAGICGRTEQAICEATLARELGYHAGLLSLAAFPDAKESELIEHCQRIGEMIPLVGFYLQPSVGGRLLSYAFWRQFCEIESVVAIKVAPFNRYQTLDVVRALADSNRWDQIALYTGNDDAILFDLLSEYSFSVSSGTESRTLQFAGGLLGHWACWTKSAVGLLERCKRLRTEENQERASFEFAELMKLAHQVTDMNSALFDAAHGFRGCIAGIHEVLHRQGLLAGTWCLDSHETLSPGQAEEITRVCRQYPHLTE